MRCDVRIRDVSARFVFFLVKIFFSRRLKRTFFSSQPRGIEASARLEPGGPGGRAVDAGADRRSRACLELRETRAGSSLSRPASPSCRPTSRVVEWVGTREKKPRVASYLALRYVLRVRGERPKHAFRVRALVRVMAVVHHVAQLLELPERLRHGASPESRHRRRRNVAPRRNADLGATPAGRSPRALAPRSDPDDARSRGSTACGVSPPPRRARLEDPRQCRLCGEPRGPRKPFRGAVLRAFG